MNTTDRATHQNSIRNLGLAAAGISALTLGLSFALSDLYWGILAALLICVLWSISLWKRWTPGCVLSLFLTIIGISIAVILDASQVVLLLSTLATLAAWDLCAFYRLLVRNKNIIKEPELVRTHLLRLIAVLILGLMLPTVSYAFELELKFWQVFLLGLGLLLGLSQVFSQLKQKKTE